MKRFSLIFIVLTLLAGSALAQKKPVKSTLKPVTMKKTVVVPREKFDPTRDPAADFAIAVETAKKTGRRIILDVGGEWCGWCIHMDKFIYRNKALSKLLRDNFVWVKVNMNEENENEPFLAAYPEIQAYPHLFVLDEAGKLLHSQDTALLERDESYDLKKFTDFVKTWMPAKTPVK